MKVLSHSGRAFMVKAFPVAVATFLIFRSLGSAQSIAASTCPEAEELVRRNRARFPRVQYEKWQQPSVSKVLPMNHGALIDFQISIPYTSDLLRVVLVNQQRYLSAGNWMKRGERASNYFQGWEKSNFKAQFMWIHSATSPRISPGKCKCCNTYQ